MQYYHVDLNKEFIDRDFEISRLHEITQEQEAKIIVVYGRRRVGKTELLEQFFRKRNLLKFEGRDKIPPNQQMQFIMRQLANYTKNKLYENISVTDWVPVLQYIADEIKNKTVTLYFEEVQWLANYKDDFISALKYVWDNHLRHHKQLILILCGSSPSFMINHIVKSSALYNRSQYEFPLREFNLIETKSMLAKHSQSEVLDTFLTIGGMPEYLKRVRKQGSFYINLATESFLPGSFFLHEYERIFASSLSEKKSYKTTIEFLSKRKFATRKDISSHLKTSSGGMLTDILRDLEICGYIECYSPFDKPQNSLLTRYCISDAYLQFYFKFLKSITKQIDQGDFIKTPLQALNMTTFQQWLGYAFERFCRKYQRQIAIILGFSAVKYRAGSYYSRNTEIENPGYQIDLLFDRDDKVMTICEIKYSQNKISSKVINEFANKLELLPNQRNKTIQRVLITNQPSNHLLQARGYFDRIIGIEDLFNPNIW